MSFSEKIQVLRKQHNISQEQLAEQLNVTRQAISKWETGESLPDIDNIKRLGEIFDVSLDYLLKDAHDETMPSTSMTDMPDPNEDAPLRYRFDFQNAIYPLALLIFLVSGAIFDDWSHSWIIFVAAWAIDEIIDYVRKGKFGISVYGIATALFIITGFVFDMWSYAWLFFVAAWVVDEMVVKEPKKMRKKNLTENHGENEN